MLSTTPGVSFSKLCVLNSGRPASLSETVSRGKVKTSVAFEMQLPIHLLLLHIFLLQLLSCVFSLTQELGRNNIREPVVSISGTVINLQN